MNLITSILKPLLIKLKSKNLKPLKIQQTKILDYYLSNFVFEEGHNLITNSVFTGISQDKNLSLLKALSEFIERNAFKSGKKMGLKICQTERSDGFAAFPNFPNREIALKNARKNALNEAIERFVWATWWDNQTGSHIEKFSPKDLNNSIPLLNTINFYTPIESIYKIEPYFLNTNKDLDEKLIIFFVKLKNHGYISAGAVDTSKNLNLIYQRCLSELIRHSLAYHRYLTHKILPKTIYEKRLVFFANGKGNQLVESRLRSVNNKYIRLPKLHFDSIIPHDFDKYITVYRCLYENQPPFIGGKIERLCL